MDDKQIETLVINAMQIGVINTLANLGLISEMVSMSQAQKTYGRKLIKEWRSKRWIVGVPSGNGQRSKVYFKRSELDTASRMLDMVNIVPKNNIFGKLRYPEIIKTDKK